MRAINDVSGIREEKAEGQCEWPCCDQDAVWEAWFGRGVIIRLQVCDEHVKKSRGHKKDQPPA